jgi:hypothetical protein
MTPQELVAIMAASGSTGSVESTEDGVPRILWDMGGATGMISFYDDNGSVLFTFPAAGTGADMETINAWNRDRRFSRGFMDTDGSAVLELDLDFTGGISRERVADWLRVCVASVYQWTQEVLTVREAELGEGGESTGGEESAASGTVAGETGGDSGEDEEDDDEAETEYREETPDAQTGESRTGHGNSTEEAGTSGEEAGKSGEEAGKSGEEAGKS